MSVIEDDECDDQLRLHLDLGDEGSPKKMASAAPEVNSSADAEDSDDDGLTVSFVVVKRPLSSAPSGRLLERTATPEEVVAEVLAMADKSVDYIMAHFTGSGEELLGEMRDFVPVAESTLEGSGLDEAATVGKENVGLGPMANDSTSGLDMETEAEELDGNNFILDEMSDNLDETEVNSSVESHGFGVKLPVEITEVLPPEKLEVLKSFFNQTVKSNVELRVAGLVIDKNVIQRQLYDAVMNAESLSNRNRLLTMTFCKAQRDAMDRVITQLGCNPTPSEQQLATELLQVMGLEAAESAPDRIWDAIKVKVASLVEMEVKKYTEVVKPVLQELKVSLKADVDNEVRLQVAAAVEELKVSMKAEFDAEIRQQISAAVQESVAPMPIEQEKVPRRVTLFGKENWPAVTSDGRSALHMENQRVDAIEQVTAVRFICSRCPTVCHNSSGLATHMKLHQQAVHSTLSGEAVQPRLNSGNRQQQLSEGLTSAVGGETSNQSGSAQTTAVGSSQIPQKSTAAVQFKCDRCEKICANEGAFGMHMKKHRKADAKMSGKSANPSQQETQIELGKLVKLGKRPATTAVETEPEEKRVRFECEKCEKICTKAGPFARHLKWHQAADAKMINAGADTVQQETQVQPEGPKNLTKQPAVADGIEITEPKTKEFPCEQCGKTYSTLNGLKVHQTCIHRKKVRGRLMKTGGDSTVELGKGSAGAAEIVAPKPIKGRFRCEQCGKNFPTPRGLIGHRIRFNHNEVFAEEISTGGDPTVDLRSRSVVGAAENVAPKLNVDQWPCEQYRKVCTTYRGLMLHRTLTHKSADAKVISTGADPLQQETQMQLEGPKKSRIRPKPKHGHFPCGQCPKVCSTIPGRKAHRTRKHGKKVGRPMKTGGDSTVELHKKSAGAPGIVTPKRIVGPWRCSK